MEIKRKALLIGVNINDEYYFFKSMNELEELVKACGMESTGRIVQNLNQINPAFYIGMGKLKEIEERLDEYNPDVVVFNNELSPSQIKNIESKLKIPILDRTSLILEIFSKRASTKEAKLQVEIAKLKYMLPRLAGMNMSLGRQGGGSNVSNKGSGEKKIELDRRKIESRINKLNAELDNISVIRNVQRRKRKDSNIPLVSLVGYTNSGKSTLLNTFIELYSENEDKEDKKVLEEDMLFATLQTSVRKIKLKNKCDFLLSDTVGFIRELPHTLIKAFRTTLDEVRQADLLLHIIDFSDPDFEENINIVNGTLKEIGANDIPVIYVYNKSELKESRLPIIKEDRIYISAKEKIGIEELSEIISNKIFSNYVSCKMKIPYARGDILSYLSRKYGITKKEYVEDGTIIIFKCDNKDYTKYKEYIIVK